MQNNRNSNSINDSKLDYMYNIPAFSLSNDLEKPIDLILSSDLVF